METTYGFKLFMSNASGTGLTNVRRKRLFQEIKMSSKMEPHINTSKMTIQEVAVDAVTPYEKNPRKIPQEAIDRVAASIKELQHIQKLIVLREDKPQRSELHPTMKPVKLIARLVGNSSREGDTVLDLFGGSGTTLIVSEQMGRNCRMMEYDPIYCQVIINRWEALTGKTAEKIC